MSNPLDYTVGWICAIHTEYVAAQIFLDDNHELPTQVSPNDNNDYTLGKIGAHNVVIAVLPNSEYGLSSAAGVARDMLHSFPNLRIGLLVGIGGGAPTAKHDIRLGDVVVGVSNNSTQGAVFQYDFGKAMQGQEFLETGFLNQPPPILRTAVNGLMAQYDLKGNQLSNAVDNALNKNRRLRKKGYSRPEAATDRLYQSHFIHSDLEIGCEKACGDDPSNLIERPERDEDDDLIIHHGLIASANTLMKDALVRDELIAKKDVLCFEMEAAGLMNHFPCLVVRGICDYADSHKNKEWQGYAAMTAAAYAKDLLLRISPTRVEAEKKISEDLANIQRSLVDVQQTSHDIKTDVLAMKADKHSTDIKRWISPSDPSINIINAKKSWHPGTIRWFIDSEEFSQWTLGSRQHLWLYGIPGCGKTVLSAILFDHLPQEDEFVTLTFFFDFTDVKKQRLDDMLRSFVFQLYSSHSESQKELDSLFKSCDNGNKQPDTHALSACFKNMMLASKKYLILLDALDECSDGRELLKWMEEFMPALANVQVIATGRPEHHLQQNLPDWMGKENCLALKKESVDADIQSYVKARVKSPEFKRWDALPEVLEQIKSTVGGKANGMFRWAACQLDSLRECLDREAMQEALESLPDDLNTTYARILQNIPRQRRKKTIRLLQFLVYSERSLILQEAVDLIAVRLDGGFFDAKDRLPCPEEISGYCSSLVSFAQSPVSGTDFRLQLAHFSVKEYLLSCDISDFIYPNPEIVITDTCITYLSSIKAIYTDTRAAMLDFHCPRISTTAIIEGQYPFAKYAAENWAGHAKVAERSEQILEKVVRFLLQKEHFKLWINLFDSEDPAGSTVAPETKFGSPLYYACYDGLEATAQKLLLTGEDANAEGGLYGSPLVAAAAKGHKGIVRLLLDKDATIDGVYTNAKFPRYSQALVKAAQQGYPEIVQLLLDRGVDANAKGKYQTTALHAAARKGPLETVRLLLSRGADIEVKDNMGRTAFAIATTAGRTDIIQLLAEKGADEVQDNHHEHIMKTFEEAGCNVNYTRVLCDESKTVWCNGIPKTIQFHYNIFTFKDLKKPAKQ